MQRIDAAAGLSAGRLKVSSVQSVFLSARRRPSSAAARRSLVAPCLASNTPQEPSMPAAAAQQTTSAAAGTGSAAPAHGSHAPDAAAARHTGSTAQSQTQLLKQLLQLSSISSTDSLDGDQLPLPPHHTGSSSSSSSSSGGSPAYRGPQHVQQRRPVAQSHAIHSSSSSSTRRGMQEQPGSLYDDASAADYDPMLLDIMGFTSVAQYLQHKLDTSLAQSKVDLLHASIWLSLGAGLVTPLGGYATYTHLIHEVTLNGAATDNLTFVWLLLLLYYTVKGGVMSLATGWRALSAHAAEPELLQDLEQLQSQHQRRAYWQLQERLIRYDNRANRCYAEFALASMLLGVLLLMKGGPDNLQMQLETVDQAALSGLVLMMWVFWESYFSSIAAVVQLVQLGSAWVSKVQHKQKWQSNDDE